jgi:UDP-glucuronate 4-epimerase
VLHIRIDCSFCCFYGFVRCLSRTSRLRLHSYITDIVDGVVRSIDTPLACEVINLGNGRPYKLHDFIALVEDSLGRTAEIEVLPEQPGDVQHSCANIDKARRLLG